MNFLKEIVLLFGFYRETMHDFLLTQQENNLALAKISLCEAMNYPSGSCPEIVAEIAVGTPAGAAAYGEVLAYALEKHPKAQQAAYNVQQMRLKYSVAKGKYYPSVSPMRISPLMW